MSATAAGFPLYASLGGNDSTDALCMRRDARKSQ
jgi:hypothetical protein